MPLELLPALVLPVLLILAAWGPGAAERSRSTGLGGLSDPADWSATGSNGHILADMVRRWDDRPGCGAAHGGAGRLAGRMWSAGGTDGHFLAVDPTGGPSHEGPAD